MFLWKNNLQPGDFDRPGLHVGEDEALVERHAGQKLYHSCRLGFKHSVREGVAWNDGVILLDACEQRC